MTQTVEEVQETAEDTQKGKYLTFSIGKEQYGIEIRYVTEIIGIQTITGVPELPEYVRGIINLRGKIIPVVDVRLRFRKEFMEYNDRTCIIVIDIFDVSIGLIVDTVAEVLNIDEGNVVPPPDVKTGFQNRYVKGIGKVGNDVKLLLDCEKLLGEGVVENISSNL
jgi:purine-binding chemotaxis protein CheW